MTGWTFEQYGCFEDGTICVLAFLCPCYLFGKTSYKVGWNCLFCGFIFLVPCVNLYAAARIRFLIRKHLRIDGTGCDDCIQGICCGPCALAQEAREVRHEGHIMVRD